MVINSMASDPTAKKAFEELVAGFKRKHPEVSVKVNTIDHESYKVQIRTWLPTQAPDVATWFAGNRARFFIEKGLVEPIDDVWKDLAGDFSEGAKSVSSWQGKAYLLPLNYYHWGVYYRKDVFESAGIKAPPKTWDELLAAIAALKAKSIIPVALGTKQAWPAAAWFDFINMRLNGYDFHMALLAGKESFVSAKVQATMDRWKQLIDAGAFPSNAPAMTWQEASALMWQGKAAMYLMGNFIASEIPASVSSKMGFFSFPVIDKAAPQAEVAPTDVIFIPAKAKNKEDARKFLRYAATVEAQTAYNNANGLLPPHLKATVSEAQGYRRQGLELLASAKGLAQFFDRDADPQVAKAGMDGFVEFLAFPARRDVILNRIETAQKRVARESR
jgi:multiple sugar transport system substrate-binding protein